MPTGLEDVSMYPMLVAELLARNWTEAEVKAALAENLLRVFKKVEEVSGAQGCAGHRDSKDQWDSRRMRDVWGQGWHWGTRGRG